MNQVGEAGAVELIGKSPRHVSGYISCIINLVLNLSGSDPRLFCCWCADRYPAKSVVSCKV